MMKKTHGFRLCSSDFEMSGIHVVQDSGCSEQSHGLLLLNIIMLSIGQLPVSFLPVGAMAEVDGPLHVLVGGPAIDVALIHYQQLQGPPVEGFFTGNAVFISNVLYNYDRQSDQDLQGFSLPGTTSLYHRLWKAALAICCKEFAQSLLLQRLEDEPNP